METVKTDFNNQQHGFQFKNSFDFPTLLHYYLPMNFPLPVAMGDVTYGLCGGMCCASLDYFYTGKQLPSYTEVEDINLQLFLCLWNRQLDTLKPATIRKIFEWMLRDDKSLARSMKPWESQKVREGIDQGDPVILALIRSKGITGATNNHQVLATGYDYDPGLQHMTIYIYDPNWPDEEPELAIDLSTPGQGINIEHSKDGSQRGFFKIDYKQETPP
jgi:hypothetical protein